MSVDATPPEAPVPAPDWKLPSVRNIEIRRARGEPPPKLEYFRSSIPDLPEVVEFEVVLDGPVPARAMPPVLYSRSAHARRGDYVRLVGRPASAAEADGSTLSSAVMDGGPIQKMTHLDPRQQYRLESGAVCNDGRAG